MKKTYYALAEGFILGSYRKIGDPVGALTEGEAKYPKQAGQICDIAPVPPKAKAPAKEGDA